MSVKPKGERPIVLRGVPKLRRRTVSLVKGIYVSHSDTQQMHSKVQFFQLPAIFPQ